MSMSIRYATRADEQGLTLQTLIVTAVVVLLAVASGVVIVAITRSAQDDLEGTTAKIDGRCKPWEIYDAELAAAGAGGGKEAFYREIQTTDRFDSEIAGTPGWGGVTSSAVGCLAPCYLTLSDDRDYTLDRVILEQGAGTELERRWPIVMEGMLPPGDLDLKFDASNRPPRYVFVDNPDMTNQRDAYMLETAEVRIGVAYNLREEDHLFRSDIITEFEHDRDYGFYDHLLEASAGSALWVIEELLDDDYTATELRNGEDSLLGVPLGWKDPPRLKGSTVAIRVSVDQSACEIYDTVTDEVYMSSRDVQA